MKRAVIKTDFGALEITYQTHDELDNGLKSLPEDVTLIQPVAQKLAPRPTRHPKPGYEDVYAFTPNSVVELLRLPPSAVEAAALALFAYYPDTVPSAMVERSTGISGVVRRVLTQTPYRKYFQKVGKDYALTRDGLALVVEGVVPKLRAAATAGGEAP
jgi:hypothetical protein